MKLSVIIPTLDEADYLAATVASLRENAVRGGPYEIIIADTGSTDGSPELALDLRLKLVRCVKPLPGRASALNQGAASAAGDVLMFLDADTLLPKGYDDSLEKALMNFGVVGGAFEFALDGEEFGLRVVEILNRLRYRVRQRYYGDQGVFVRTDVFRKIGGFPERRLLETAYFCSALRKAGKLRLIKESVRTSPRRFLAGGIYKVLTHDIRIWFLDLIGISVEQHAETYWKKNEKR
jgi:rSAM/selenodomain-associated transferase 2